MKPLAIVGLGPETEESAPWMDETWERWGLPWSHNAPRCHFLFEMHDERHIFELETSKGGRLGYQHRLQELELPVYVQKPFHGVPNCLEYPLDEVVADLGRDYFGSTIAYMLALAIHRERECIGIWGVDLTDSYDHQRENLAWLCGMAEGRGLVLTGPSIDRILAYEPTEEIGGVTVSYPVRYGFAVESFADAWGAA